MRDGSQWRPMVHVQDTARAQMFMLTAPAGRSAARSSTSAPAANNYQLGPLAQLICDTVPGDVRIEWYGDADHRSYQVAFDRIEALGWKAQRTAVDGARRDP